MDPRSKYLSASRVKTLRQCPMKFYLSYCSPDKIEMPQSWGAANGTLLHEVFEEYASGERRDWKKNLMEKFRLAMADKTIRESVFKFSRGTKITTEESVANARYKKCGQCPFVQKMADGTPFCLAMGKPANEFKGSPRSMITDTVKLAYAIFDDDFNPIDDMKVVGVEHKFEITFENGISTLGFIDLVSEVNEDTIEIRDYKSAKRIPSDREILEGWVAKDIQMQMYYAVAKYSCDNNIPPFSDKYKNIFVTIHFLRKTPITMVYTEKDYDQVLRTLKQEFDRIRAIRNPLPAGAWGKDKNWICNYCNADECNKACIKIHGKTRKEIIDEHQK